MLAPRGFATAALLLAFLAAACTQGNPTVGGVPSHGPPVASVTPLTPSASPLPPTPSPSASPILAEGRNFGYIKSVDPNGTTPTLVFDLAQFFSGHDADQAAIEDGVIAPGQHVDNDVYIRNVNPRLRTVPISPTVQISIIAWTNCCETQLSPDLATFASAFPGPGPTDDYHGPTSPYWLTVRNGAVVKIEEQYLA